MIAIARRLSKEDRTKAINILRRMKTFLKNTPMGHLGLGHIGLCCAASMAARDERFPVAGVGSVDNYRAFQAVNAAIARHKPKTLHARESVYFWPRTPYGTRKRLAVVGKMLKEFGVR